MFDLNDPNTFWLNVTNIALGIITLICCVAVVYGVLQEVRARQRERKSNLAGADDHSLIVTDLGITMADGGVPVKEKPLAVSEKGLTYDIKPKKKSRGKK